VWSEGCREEPNKVKTPTALALNLATRKEWLHSQLRWRDCATRKIEWRLTRIPYKTGYSPPSYRVAVDFLVEKSPGNRHVNKIRFIRLFHTRFNIGNKFLAKITMKRGEDLKLIPPEQAGSWKHHQADVICACKTVMWDIVRQKRIPTAVSSNDAKSCYDRIVYNVAFMCAKAWGIATPPLLSMLWTMYRMKAHVRTAHGISEAT